MKRLLIVLFLSAFLLVSCQGKSAGKENFNPKVEITKPQTLQYDSDAYYEKMGNRSVSEEFLKNLYDYSLESTAKILGAQEDVNAIYSPVSLHLALSILAEGANGETQKEILNLLHQPSPETLTKENSSFMKDLYVDNDIGQLIPTNALWINKAVTVKDSYSKKIAQNYLSAVFNGDFADEKTAVAMKDWVKEQTKGLIEPEIQLDPRTILSIFNTIYFQDQWSKEFASEHTKEEDFILKSGEKIKASFMNRSEQGTFKKGEKYLSASRGLKNRGSVVFILPKEGVTPQEILKDKALMDEILSKDTGVFGEITWSIPKYKISNQLKLNESLEALGMKRAFQLDKAEFKEITDGEAFVGKVQQDNVFSIDEKGVSAASFTRIDLMGAALVKEKAEMILNRPFIFILKDHLGDILFIGSVFDPTK